MAATFKVQIYTWSRRCERALVNIMNFVFYVFKTSLRSRREVYKQLKATWRPSITCVGGDT